MNQTSALIPYIGPRVDWPTSVTQRPPPIFILIAVSTWPWGELCFGALGFGTHGLGALGFRLAALSSGAPGFGCGCWRGNLFLWGHLGLLGLGRVLLHLAGIREGMLLFELRVHVGGRCCQELCHTKRLWRHRCGQDHPQGISLNVAQLSEGMAERPSCQRSTPGPWRPSLSSWCPLPAGPLMLLQRSSSACRTVQSLQHPAST